MADVAARRAGIVLAVCAVGALLAGLALFALSGDDDGAEAQRTTTTAAGKPVAVDHIDVGTCFNDAGEGAFDYTELAVVGCDEPHDNEIYHLFDAPGSAAYPGDDQIAEVTRNGCLAAFEPYVGKPYTDSALAILPIPPSKTSWNGGDREVVCALYDPSRKELTGSVKGSAR